MITSDFTFYSLDLDSQILSTQLLHGQIPREILLPRSEMDSTDRADPDLRTLLAVLTNQVTVETLEDPTGRRHLLVAYWAVEILLQGLWNWLVGSLKPICRKGSFRKPLSYHLIIN